MDNQKIGMFIAEQRKKKNITQQQLADLLGVTNKAVSKWETGKGLPDIGLLEELSNILEVSIDDILKTQSIEPSAGQDEADDTAHTTEGNKPLYTAEAVQNKAFITRQCRDLSRCFRRFQTLPFLLGAGLLLLSFAGTLAGIWFYFAQIRNAMIAVGIAAVLILYFNFQGYQMTAARQYRRKNQTEGFESVISFQFFENEMMIKSATTEYAVAYHSISKIVMNQQFLAFQYHKKHEILYPDMLAQEMQEVTSFLQKHAVSAKRVEYDPEKRAKRLCTAACLLSGAFLLLMQIAFSFVSKQYDMVYISQWIPFLVSGLAILCFGFGTALWFKAKSKKMILVMAAVILLQVWNLGSTIHVGYKNRILTSTSRNGKYTMVVRQNTETGMTDIYRQQAIFARRKGNLPYTAGSDIKLQWLTGDCCTVTYRSPDDGKTHQYIETYGSRSDNGYFYVSNVVQSAEWVEEGKQSNYSVSTDGEFIVISNGKKKESYHAADCVQFGTHGIALCKDGLPKWTIVLNEDCRVDSGMSAMIEGSITLCKVSMKRTVPWVFRCTNPVMDNLSLDGDL